MANSKRTPRDIDLDAKAEAALEEARALPRGPEKTEALRKAGTLRNAAEVRGFVFARRDRPPKD
jgi:hypothetical protein